MNRKFSKTGTVAAGLILFLSLTTIVCLVSFFLLKMLGFQYDSISSVVLFFLIYMLMDLPLSILTEAAPKAILNISHGKRTILFEVLRALCCIVLDMAILKVADTLITGVSLPNLTLIFYTIISYMLQWGMDYFSGSSDSYTAQRKDGSPLQSVHFRIAQLKDAPAILPIIRQAQQYFKEHSIDQWQNGYPNQAVIETDIQNQECFVLEDEFYQIVATAVFSGRGEPTYHTIDGHWISDKPYLVIHRIAVTNDAKGTGLSSILFHEAENYAKKLGLSSLRIDTHEQNISMQRALEKNGFTACGIIHLEDGAPRIAFEKLL